MSDPAELIRRATRFRDSLRRIAAGDLRRVSPEVMPNVQSMEQLLTDLLAQLASPAREPQTWQPMRNLSEMTAVGDRLLLAWRSGYVTCGYLAPKRMTWVTPNGEYPFADESSPAFFQPLPCAPSPSPTTEPQPNE